MKKIMITTAVLWGLAGSASALEVHSSVLNNSGTFTLARSVKLGTLTDDAQGFTGKNISEAQKEKYDCTRDDNCGSTQKCSGNKCVDVCTASPCASGKQCIAQPGHTRTCVDCTSDSHCTAGKRCSGSECISCSAGDSCRCPSGQEANGSGGCRTIDPCRGVICPGGYCSGGNCSCYSGYSWNGATCIAIDPCANVTCGAGKTCSNGSCIDIPGWCGSDSACSSSQKCTNNTCVALTCGTCETASNHTCVKKSGCCTSAADCGSGYKCTANRCVETGVSCYGGTCYAGTYCDGVAKQCCDNSQKGKRKSPGKCYLETVSGSDDCEPSQFVNGQWLQGKCR